MTEILDMKNSIHFLDGELQVANLDNYEWKMRNSSGYVTALIDTTNGIQAYAGDGDPGTLVAQIDNAGTGKFKDLNVSRNMGVDGNYGAYGELWQSYTIRVQTFPALNTYIQINGDWNKGDFYNTTVTPDQNRITVNQGGMYLISVSGDFDTTSNAEVDFAIFKNGAFPVTDRDCHINRDLAAGANATLALSCLKRLANGDYIDLRAEQVTGTLSNVTFNNMNFKAVRIG
jgi:hypothetical protein